MVKIPIRNSVRYWKEDRAILNNMEQMNLAQSIFIFLIINAKHGYSMAIKCSGSDIIMGKYDKSVQKLLDKMVKLKISYDRNYDLQNIKLPEYNQFPKMDNSVIKLESLSQYRATLGDFCLALVSFGGKNPSFNQLTVTIENNISQLDQIIRCLPAANGSTTARFNKKAIEKRSEKFFQESFSSVQTKVVYAIIVQFVNFLFDFRKFIFNFTHYI